jgi:hypothetical protein
MTMPREGESVHYVAHPGLSCVAAIVDGATHPEAGDDAQWCVSLETFIAGVPSLRHNHVPHGVETGHWHTRGECTHGR